MKKSLICSLLAVSLLSACAIDPYTGEQKSPKQPGEQVSELRQEPVSALWPAARKVP